RLRGVLARRAGGLPAGARLGGELWHRFAERADRRAVALGLSRLQQRNELAGAKRFRVRPPSQGFEDAAAPLLDENRRGGVLWRCGLLPHLAEELLRAADGSVRPARRRSVPLA